MEKAGTPAVTELETERSPVCSIFTTRLPAPSFTKYPWELSWNCEPFENMYAEPSPRVVPTVSVEAPARKFPPLIDRAQPKFEITLLGLPIRLLSVQAVPARS